MSYQVLARKYRPANFAELVGQEHVLKALSSALDHQRLHHAYLFTGTRGVGKTTIARILARCLNCETGVSSSPCGECSACQEIDQGRFVDLIEVDAASRTKVEDTRELLENVQYSPVRGRYKVYLIDEVHMLSNHSFNALLKTLEEPPPHVVFLLATTDPQKLPPTVLSRCLQFNLKNMTAEKIVGHLQAVLAEESIPAEETALWQLARAANGSMRDALSLTDQAIAYSEHNLTETEVAAMLGSMDQSQVHQLFKAVCAGDAVGAMTVIDRIDEQSPDYGQALSQLLSLLHQLALFQSLPDYQPLLSEAEQQSISELASAITAEEIQLYYQLGLKARADMAWAPDPKSGFEMAVLRMIAFRPAELSGQPRTEKKKTEPATRKLTSLEKAEPANDGESSRAKPAIKRNNNQGKQQAAGEGVVDTPQSPVAPDPISKVGQSSTPQATDAELVTNKTASNKHLANKPVAATQSQSDNEYWLTISGKIGLKGLLANFANHCVLQQREGNNWYFILDKGHAAIQGNGLEKQLEKALEEYIGERLKLEFTVAELELDSPARRQRFELEQRRLKALDALQHEPTVQWLQESFSATIDEQSANFIEPAKKQKRSAT